MRRILLVLGAWVITSFTFAQKVNITKVELAGEKIIVHYDLDDNNPINSYKLDLYASRDNYATPLSKVKGDVGMEVKPGYSRKIEWNVVEEYGPYKGKLSIEIRGKVYIPFVKLQNFDTEKGYKRGSNHNLSWKPGNSNPINIELYKGGQRISGDMNQPNNGGHTFYFPSNVKPGKDYRLKISDSRNTDEVFFTGNFRIKPKVPTLLKVVGAAAIIGAGAFAAMSAGGGEKPGPDGGQIPLPPLPGN
jgi:hypothetical protein